MKFRKKQLRGKVKEILDRERDLGRVLTIEELQEVSPSHSQGAKEAIASMKWTVDPLPKGESN